MSKIATFTVTLNAPSTLPSSVNFATVAETAAGGVDFTATSGTLTFAPGQVSKTVVVPVLADPTLNTNKKFKCVLSAPVNCTLPSVASNECVISVGDGAPVVPGIAVDGPLIQNGLITNAYNNEYGRGGYFHPASGTSEGQSIMISAAFLAELALTGGTAEEIAASVYYHQLALDMLDACGDGSVTGPLLRQPIPSDPTVITLLHWLFAARSDIPSQAVVLDFAASVVAGKLRIPAVSHGASVFRVWAIYPSTSELLYGSPFSPAFDKVIPAGETQIEIDYADWVIDATNNVVINMPVSAPSGVTSWCIVYGYNGSTIIPQGDAEEAYPCWTALADGYASCAPDTFRWFDQALTYAIAHDARSGKAASWTNLRAALRRTAVRGQALTDKREVFKQWTGGFAAIPAAGDPSGMFCYSNHPSAVPPADPLLNQQWIGYAFWSRAANGDVLGTVPSSPGVAQVQLGRGFNDSWRAAEAWQDADQYLYVAVSCTKKPTLPLEHFYIYVSSTKYYSGTTRWYADIGAYALFTAVSQGTMDAGGVIEFLVPRTDFLRKDSDSAVLPVGTAFQNFGISAEMSGAYNIRLKAMRMVSGVSQAWVNANFALAIRGGQLPFFPGAMPFNIAGDTIKQQFVGYSGSPFHGYQLPDFWWFLGSEAGAVHGTLTVPNLPTADPTTGAVIHPMSLTTTVGAVTKPQNALLMEQQVRMLQAAQNHYQADGGPLGPFAHTFVVNTPDRINLGNPQPNTWVYTNDDPNTRWIGYQCRVVESLANLVLLAHSTASFSDVTAIAKTLVVNFLTWLNVAWPDLTGVSYTDPVTGVAKTIHGMPTEFDDPATMVAPVTAYEEPHGPCLIMRACIHLKLVDSTNDVLCDALITRCWNYMETQFVTAAGEMQYTWSPDPTALQWYGFWHGEIITTICVALANPGALPVGFPASTAKLRLVQTQAWLAATGVQP